MHPVPPAHHGWLSSVQSSTMDFQDIELTIDDILAVHRFWITRQYVVEKKTEVEIVEELYRRQLVVSVSQVQQCIRRWNLARPADAKPSEFSHLYSYPTSPHKQHHSPPSPSTPRTIPPVLNQDLYTDRPLPSLPPHISSSYDDLSVNPSYTYHPSQPSTTSPPSPPRSHTYFTDHHLAFSHDARSRLGTQPYADFQLNDQAGGEEDDWVSREALIRSKRGWSRAQDARKGKPSTKKAVRKRLERKEKDKDEDEYRDRRRG